MTLLRGFKVNTKPGTQNCLYGADKALVRSNRWANADGSSLKIPYRRQEF
jgi:hypothetical protein